MLVVFALCWLFVVLLTSCGEFVALFLCLLQLFALVFVVLVCVFICYLLLCYGCDCGYGLP